MKTIYMENFESFEEEIDFIHQGGKVETRRERGDYVYGDGLAEDVLILSGEPGDVFMLNGEIIATVA